MFSEIDKILSNLISPCHFNANCELWLDEKLFKWNANVLQLFYLPFLPSIYVKTFVDTEGIPGFHCTHTLITVQIADFPTRNWQFFFSLA